MKHILSSHTISEWLELRELCFRGIITIVHVQVIYVSVHDPTAVSTVLDVICGVRTVDFIRYYMTL